jgi:hypothetical protein
VAEQAADNAVGSPVAVFKTVTTWPVAWEGTRARQPMPLIGPVFDNALN